MDSTVKTLTKLLVLIGSLVLLYLLVVFVASVVQLAEAADRIHQGLGQPVFIMLMTMLLVIVASPLYMYFRFPKALVPPNEESGSEHDKYMLQLRRALSSNSLLVGMPLNNDEDVKIALGVLSKKADKVIRETAGAVFLGTALCQNGKLDGLITLSTQARMVWKIACIYHQRPSPRQLVYLYSQVAMSALLAESIDDYDFAEILSPILTAALAAGTISGAGSLTSGVVAGAGLAAEGIGVVGASHAGNAVAKLIDGAGRVAEGAVKLITNSVIDGTANAFLTLRVGCISKQYCEAIACPDKSLVRRNATFAAAGMVGDVVKDNSARIFSAAKRVAVDGVKSLGAKVTDAVVDGAKKIGNVASASYDGVKAVTNKSVEVASNAMKSVGNGMSAAAGKVMPKKE